MSHKQSDSQISRRTVLQSIGAGSIAVIGGSETVGAAAASTNYQNPVGPIGFGDVSIISADGMYYAYGTETPLDIIPIAESSDMATWSYIAPALESYPSWRNDDAGVWAPDINYYNDQYYLYYSYSKWGSTENPGIGLAISDTPDGPFVDQGPVFREADLGMTNAIDSEFLVVAGTPYLIWGSWYGIYGVQLTDDGTEYVPGTTFHLAGDKREGPMIIRENGYYYLFYSTGHCCAGYDSTYEIEVGRAETLWGPYYNQAGQDLRSLNTHHSGVAVLTGDEFFTGPGHNDAYRDPDGNWWLYYHVEATADAETRYMMLDRIQWDADDWPVIACTGTPSAQSPVPFAGTYDCADVLHHETTDESGPIAAGTYRIENVNSGLVATVAAGITTNGANIVQRPAVGGTHQQWTVETDTDTELRLRNVRSGRPLVVSGGGTGEYGNVQLGATPSSAGHHWSIEPVADGQYRIMNAHSGLALTVQHDAETDWMNLIQRTYDERPGQQWRFTTVGE